MTENTSVIINVWADFNGYEITIEDKEGNMITLERKEILPFLRLLKEVYEEHEAIEKDELKP